jgi:hypothetical protein
MFFPTGEITKFYTHSKHSFSGAISADVMEPESLVCSLLLPHLKNLHILLQIPKKCQDPVTLLRLKRKRNGSTFVTSDSRHVTDHCFV